MLRGAPNSHLHEFPLGNVDRFEQFKPAPPGDRPRPEESTEPWSLQETLLHIFVGDRLACFRFGYTALDFGKKVEAFHRVFDGGILRQVPDGLNHPLFELPKRHFRNKDTTRSPAQPAGPFDRGRVQICFPKEVLSLPNRYL